MPSPVEVPYRVGISNVVYVLARSEAEARQKFIDNDIYCTQAETDYVIKHDDAFLRDENGDGVTLAVADTRKKKTKKDITPDDPDIDLSDAISIPDLE